MTTVRGKAPIEATFEPQVEALSYQRKVSIKSGGWNGQHRFYVYGHLSPDCAARLVVLLRKALRQVRDDTQLRLNAAVNEAEKQL